MLPAATFLRNDDDEQPGKPIDTEAIYAVGHHGPGGSPARPGCSQIQIGAGKPGAVIPHAGPTQLMRLGDF